MAPIEWLNPDTWKAPAELIGDWRTIAGTGVALATIVGAITKKGRELVSRGWAAVRKRSSQQRGDLRFVPNDRETYWSIGTRGEEKVIML